MKMSTGTTRGTEVFQVAQHRRAAARHTGEDTLELYSTHGRHHDKKLLAIVAKPSRIDRRGNLQFITAAAWEQLRRVHDMPDGKKAYLRIAPNGMNGWALQVAAVGANAKAKVLLPTTPNERDGVWEKAIEVAARKAHVAILQRNPETGSARLTKAQTELHGAQLALLAMVR